MRSACILYTSRQTRISLSFIKQEKITSSSSTGYLILSQLKDSSYNFSIGFPGNKWPEQFFSITINGKDKGYLLKNFCEKGWGLYDLQTSSVQMAKNEPPKAVIKTEKIEVSPFTDILAKAAGDSTLREKPIAIKEEKKPEPVMAAKVEEPKAAVAEPAVVKTETVTPRLRMKRQLNLLQIRLQKRKP